MSPEFYFQSCKVVRCLCEWSRSGVASFPFCLITLHVLTFSGTILRLNLWISTFYSSSYFTILTASRTSRLKYWFKLSTSQSNKNWDNHFRALYTLHHFMHVLSTFFDRWRFLLTRLTLTVSKLLRIPPFATILLSKFWLTAISNCKNKKIQYFLKKSNNSRSDDRSLSHFSTFSS